MARKLAATLFITLDGVVEEPQLWSFPYWGDETAAFKNAETMDASDALLLGRVTYEGFAAAWPGRKDEAGFADKFNSMPKYVLSRTLKKADWTNSHVLGKHPAEEIAKLKAQSGKDIVVHGSPTVVRWLLEQDLLDELRLIQYPLVLGKGKRLFESAPPAKLQLKEAKPLSKGTMLMVYDCRGATKSEA